MPGGGERKSGPRIIAHRGASGVAVQNSLEAFRRAKELGADGIELDVHATLDGVLLVHHDPVVPGVGGISETSSTNLARYRLPNGEPLPTLEAALRAAGGLDYWVEVKTLPAARDSQFLETLSRGPTPGQYAVHSFDHRIIQRLGRAEPSLRRGALLASYLLDTLAAVRETGLSALWQEARLIDAALVATVHQAGLELIAWTVNDDREAIRLAELGVDGLCGNFPDLLARACGR
ncbi:MAG TPA: glycerophosphodiester phosphodiesterase [Gemmatimonadales bacterium]|nr:glycerophosphodiester phosphodiesterase [Gemmatimonadales bacterium]